MDRGVSWAESAWQDIEETAVFIARDSEHYAKTFIRRVRDAARSLRTMPRRGRVVPELGDPSIREIMVGSHRLIYQVQPETVFILGVVHGSRDLAALWKRERRPT